MQAVGEYIHPTGSFGQPAQVKWEKGNVVVDHFKYEYDGVGNVLQRADLGNRKFDQNYHYDDLDRMDSYLGPRDMDYEWVMDATGNRRDKNDSARKKYGTPQYQQTQVVDNQYSVGGRASQINLSIRTKLTADVNYDAWGNPTRISSVDVSEFRYDALGRRIISIEKANSANPVRRDAYFDNTRLIEERDGSPAGSLTAQWVWSGAGTSTVVLRDRNADGNSSTGSFGVGNGLEERRTAITDGRGNTTAVIDVSASGSGVIERFIYDQDGQPFALNAAREMRIPADNQPVPLFGESVTGWEHRFGQMRWVGVLAASKFTEQSFGFYEIGGGTGGLYDPQNGRTLAPDPSAYADGRNPYLSLEGFSGKPFTFSGLMHGALDLVGIIDPTPVSDGINALWYGLEGNYKEMTKSAFAAFVPYAGDLAKINKWGRAIVTQATRYADSVSQAAAINRKLTSRIFSASLHGFSGAAAGAAGGFIGGGIDSWASGKGFWDGAWAGAEWGAIQGGIGGSVRGFINSYVCFVAGTRVVVGVEDAAGRDLIAEGIELAPAGAVDVGGETALAMAPVALSAGTRRRYVTVAIEDLVARGGGEYGDGGGQTVIARDEHDPAGPLVRRRIVRTFERTAYILRVLTLRDHAGREQTLRVTEEHPFYSVPGSGGGHGEWTPAKLLAAGDRVSGDSGGLTVVSNGMESRPAGVTVYNMEVAGSHTYFVQAEGAAAAQPAWVHNATLYGELRGRQIQAETRKINVRNGKSNEVGSGLNYALAVHGGSGPKGKSQFTVSGTVLKRLLQTKVVVSSKIRQSGTTGNYIREVDIGTMIGKLPVNKGGVATSVLTVITDVKGNLVNTFPGTLGRRSTI